MVNAGISISDEGLFSVTAVVVGPQKYIDKDRQAIVK